MANSFKFEVAKVEAGREVLAGLTSFLATMYIIIVNPAILAQAGLSFAAVLTATVVVSALSSIFMGLYARNPIVVAPGMGINSFFAFTLVLGKGIPFATALGAVFWSGIIFLLLSVFNIRVQLVKAIPRPLRYGIAVGIGLFISLIGLVNGGFISHHDATLVSKAPFNAGNITFLCGLALTALLVARKVKGALVLGIIATTLLAIPLGRFWGTEAVVGWHGLFRWPDFSLFWALDLLGSLKLAFIPVIFTFLFIDLFDSVSTFIGVSEAGGLLDHGGEPRRLKESLIVDAIATTISGIFGTSSATSYIESAAGIEEGGRTGLTAVVAGLCFLPFMFFSPLLEVIPKIATAPALVLVGAFMMQPVAKIRWGHFDEALPAFLAMILIPLTYSISQGIIWGFLSWTLLKLTVGKKNEVPVGLWVIDGMAVIALVLAA